MCLLDIKMLQPLLSWGSLKGYTTLDVHEDLLNFGTLDNLAEVAQGGVDRFCPEAGGVNLGA